MKKVLACGLALALTLSAGATALACGGHGHGHGGHGHRNNVQAPRYGVCAAYDHDCRNDADGDGLCDICGNGEICPLCDTDGDGLCDSCGFAHYHTAEAHDLCLHRRGRHC